ncbi:unnamed protein product [Paramecium sonneborni]|uniref:Uncharacterized protein n=1 Tax=Paramecium sonneborni TaxID=65129 RepID=A0A8S1LC60_9CILI|nr:unnamed protein product [Paramecium sonneborni]
MKSSLLISKYENAIQKYKIQIKKINNQCNNQSIYRNKNQQFFNELNLLKQEQSKLTNIQLENQFIKDEILQCHQLIEQILLEKQNLQQQIQQVVSEQNKFDNLQQENERLLQLIFELNEKAKFLSEDEKKRLNQKDMKQINVQNTIKKFQQCQNQQTIQYPKKINQISNSLNLDYVNKCGHKFSIQQLENIIFKAFTNKQIAHCDKCSQPIQEKLCLIIQCLGKFYIETKYKSNLLGIKKIINQKFNQNSEMLAICKNKKCNFFCIWNQTQDQLQSRQTYSFCLCCCEQSVINPFLPDQIQKEIMQRI